MRRKITAANWKMNKTQLQVMDFVLDFKEKLPEIGEKHRIVIAAPYVYLGFLLERFEENPAVEIYAQNMHQEDAGAFTGEISHSMLQSIGINGVLIGHSERREIFGEEPEIIQAKMKQACDNNMQVILCCGEPLRIRDLEEHRSYILRQLDSAFEGIEEESMKNVTLAYEPIWAIGTGRTASPEQAQEIHELIRTFLATRFNDSVAASTSILYGGSVKPENAEELFSMPDIDGGLIGGASLQAESFIELIEIHSKVE